MFVFDYKKLRREREKNKWSYGDMERELKRYVPTASKAAIFSWENGSVPTANYLMAICQIFGKRPEDFMIFTSEDIDPQKLKLEIAKDRVSRRLKTEKKRENKLMDEEKKMKARIESREKKKNKKTKIKGE